MSRAKYKADQRADTRGRPWVGMPQVVIDSPAYRSLSDRAVRILYELLRRFNGYNNGSVAMSQREIGEAIGTKNYGSIGRAIAQLMDHGLINVTTEGKWKEREAREYRLTFVTTTRDGRHVTATNDYIHWTADRPRAKSGADHVSAKKSVSAEGGSAGRGKLAEDVSARIAQSRRKTAVVTKAAAEDVSPLIGKPYPVAEMGQEKPPRIKPQNLAADHFASDMSEVRREVRSALKSIRSSHGPQAVMSVARSAALNPDRVSAFLADHDDLAGPLIFHLRRALNAYTETSPT